MYISIDDVIDAAFRRQDNFETLRSSSSSYLDEEVRSKLHSFEVTERTNRVMMKREELARQERERILELKRQQIARDLLRKEEAEKANALKERQRLALHDARSLANDVVAGVSEAVSPEIAEVVRTCYNIVLDLSEMFAYAIDRRKYVLQPSTRWWLEQVDVSSDDHADPRLCVALDVLREVVDIFSGSGFKLSWRLIQDGSVCISRV